MATYMKATEVAKILRITTQTVKKLIKDKKLKAIKVGCRERIDAEDFERFLKERAA